MEGVKVTKLSPVHTDERGEILDLLNETISNVGMISTKAGALRASHYHKNSVQYSYIQSGKFKVIVAPFDNLEKKEEIILNAGELIEIQKLIIHKFECLEDSVMINMETLSRDGDGYEADTIRVNI